MARVQPTSVELLRRALLSRRAVLGGALAAGAAGVLPRTRRDPAADLAATTRLLGLEFLDEERGQAESRLTALRDSYHALRAAPLDRQTPPALRFDPSAPPPAAAPMPQWTPPPAPRIESALDLAFASVEELGALLRSGATSSRALTELALERLETHDATLHCVVTLLREQALAEAERADAEIARGEWRGPLHGIPYGAKDLLAARGAPTTFGAAPFRDQVIDADAAVIEKLRDAGAVLVAKLSLGALAMGDLWYGGRTRNPWRPEQGSSGSSAGSAAAVAAGLVPFAIGSETLGSIVSPCTRCGATGLRPTFGAVSRAGAMPLSWTMDKLGPIARTAADCALVYDAMRGADPRDPDSRDTAFDWQPRRSLDGLRIGVLGQEQWREAPEAAFLDTLGKAGARPVEVQLPDAPLRDMLVILHAEASAAFERLVREGGVRGLTGQRDRDWPNQMRTARTIPAVEYLTAQRLRSDVIAGTHRALDAVDVWLAPTFGNAALTLSNLTGHPCMVMPLAARDDGRPLSITVLGRMWGEAAITTVAEHWQAHSEWHRRRPPLD